MAIKTHSEFSIRITTLEMEEDGGYGLRETNTFDAHHPNINYRAEGNANIVLALPLRCQVLRLPKSKRKSTTEHDSQPLAIFYAYKYIKSVSLLFGTHLTSPPTLVRVQCTNESSFEKWLNDLRPSERLLASSDDMHFEYGLLYPDAALLNASQGSSGSTTFAVEIKPKQGWHIRCLPDAVIKMFDVERGAVNKCRFCSMQYLKANEGKIARVGEFCPLDLFSGNFPRLNKALRCLAESPQNNFRIFRDGHLVYTEGNHRSELEQIVSEIFSADADQSERKTCDDFFALLGRMLVQPESISASENISASSKIALPNDCILDRILNLQLLALETMPSIARKYSNELPLFDTLTYDANWPFEHLNGLSRKIYKYASRKLVIDKPFLQNTLQLTQEELYEIGATALDCSIMLTFQIHGKQIDTHYVCNHTTIDGVNLTAKSSVFDLDPKLYPKHFIKYIERTKKSYAACNQRLSTE